jgi:hypothetical protein
MNAMNPMPYGPALVPPLPPAPLGLQLPAGGQAGIPPPVPPVVAPVPPIVAPAQPPYPADQGSIARELWNLTAGQTPAQVMADMHSMHGMYENGNPDLDKIVDTITSAEELLCFLTIARNGMVSVVHSAKRYSAGFGNSGPAHMRLLVMVGEKVGDQMPPWQMTPAGGLQDWVSLAEHAVPTRAALVAELEADPPAALATTTVGPAGNALGIANLSKLAYLPRAWAPYFLTEMSAWSVVLEIERLTLTLPVDLRPEAGGLLSWAMVACTRESAVSQDSALHARWQPVPMDRKIIAWQQRRLQAVLRIPAFQPSALDANQAFQSAMEVVKSLKPATEATKTTKLSVSELKRLRASMSVNANEVETLMPDMHKELQSEAKTTTNVTNIVARKLQAASKDCPVLICVSPELVKDIKNFHYSIPYDTSYGDSHRGIGPFSVYPMSLKLQQEKRRAADRFSQASHTTMEDVKALESRPTALPQDFNGLCQRMNAYLRLLEHTVGTYSFHTIQVRAMYETLLSRVDVFSEITPRQILYLLWAIFLDARQFFSKSVEDNEKLPDSSLTITAQMLSLGVITMDLVGVPEDEFLGLATPRQASGSSFSTLFPPTQRPNQEPPPSTGRANFVNDSLPTNFKAVMTPFLRAHPKINAITVMNHSNPPIKFPEVNIGKGLCLNYHLLGACSAKRCNFNHHTENPATAARMREILGIIQPNIEAYCQEAARAKKPRTGDYAAT